MQLIVNGFLENANRYPNHLAIVDSAGASSYSQLELLTRGLAKRLRSEPLPTNARIAIYGQRRRQLVVAMIGCMRAGYAFSVFDANYPTLRLSQMWSVLQPNRLLMIDDTVADETTASNFIGGDLILRVTTEELMSQSQVAIESPASMSSSSAYFLFTSGTTGIPKCIATGHEPLIHFIKWYTGMFPFGADSRFSMLSGLAHDPVFRDIFVPLSNGASVHIPEQEVISKPSVIHGWLKKSQVTNIHATPQLCKVICAGREKGQDLPDVRFVFSGGDGLRRSLAIEIIKTAPKAKIINFYGASETPQAMGFHVFSAEDHTDRVPIGKGIADVELLILDEHRNPVLPGSQGEIAIRTKYLSIGYLGDSRLTEQKYLPCSESADPAVRLYLTGDDGYARPDGAVIVTGRRDDQVKIRGFRVELSEVTHHLENLTIVKEAVVLPFASPTGELHIVAFLIRSEAAQESSDDLLTSAVRGALASKMPEYMVPGSYFWLPKMPLSPNGKVDRNKLLAMPLIQPTSNLAMNKLEREFVHEWGTILGIPNIKVESNFVELGGDSLSFIEASSAIEKKLGWLPSDWERLSIRELASSKQVSSSPWTTIGSSVLLRALSILLIIYGHFGGWEPQGSVVALMVIAGMSFGKYQLNATLQSNRTWVVWRSIFRIALPTILYTAFLQLRYTSLEWQSLLLMSNFVSPFFAGGFDFWFINVLVQNLALLGLLLLLPGVRRLIRKDVFRFGLVAWAICLGLRLVIPVFWSTEHLFNRVPHMMLVMMLLGWLLVHADTRVRKLVVFGAIALTVELPAPSINNLVSLPFLATIMLLFLPTVSLPILLSGPIKYVASASLFIYLTHYQIDALIRKLPFAVPLYLKVLLAALGGVLIWKTWEIFGGATGKVVRRLAREDNRHKVIKSEPT